MKKRIFAGSLVLLVALVALVGVILAQPATAGPAASEAQQTEDPEGNGKAIYMEISQNLNGEDLSGGVLMTFEDPAELPDEDEIARGLFLGREGNTLHLGSGSISVEVAVEVINGEEAANMVDAQHDGPTLSVTFGPDTLFYQDITEVPEVDREMLESGRVTIPSVVEPGTADDLGENMMIRVWGTRDGDQLAADVIVYEQIR